MLPVSIGGHHTLAQPNGWRKIYPAGLCRRSYQGWPFKSGTFGEGSGNPPDILINAATNIPAHPPPKNDANNHQAETIRVPPSCRWSRLPGVQSAPATLRSYVWDRPNFLASNQALQKITKRSGLGRTFSPALSPDRLLELARLGRLSSRQAAPVAYNKNSGFQLGCKENFGLRLRSEAGRG